MSEWDELRDKYKNKNILPSMSNLDRIFAIGDKQQRELEVIYTMITNHDLLPHGERGHKLVDEVLGVNA